MFMSCYEYLVIFVCDQGKHFSRMKTSHRTEVGTGGKLEGEEEGFGRKYSVVWNFQKHLSHTFEVHYRVHSLNSPYQSEFQNLYYSSPKMWNRPVLQNTLLPEEKKWIG